MADVPIKWWEFEGCRLEAGDEGCLWRGDRLVHLQPKALEVLKVLVKCHDRVISRTDILNLVWPETFVEEGNLNFCISSIRKSLKEEFADGPDFISTVPKLGYKFALPVKTVYESSPATEPHDKREKESVVVPSLGKMVIVLVSVLFFTSFGAWWFYERGGISPVSVEHRHFNSLAVFPAKSLANGPQEDPELIGLAVADSLVTRLGKLNVFAVRPISSVLDFNASETDELEYSKRLEVDLVLTGSYLKTHNGFKFSFRLIDPRDGALVWNREFETPDEDLTVLQDNVSARVAREFAKEFRGSTETPSGGKPTQNQEAYRLYLQGKYLQKLRKADKERAEGLFKKAVVLDPEFAEAYVGIADSQAFSEPPQNGLDAAINKAIELDPSLADAWATRGFVRMFHHWDWDEAEASLKKAVELEPYNSKARHWLGVYHSLKGDFRKAREDMLLALELDPASVFIRYDLVQLLYFERKYEEAEGEARELLSLEPRFEETHGLLSYILYLKGDKKASAEQIIERTRSEPELSKGFAKTFQSDSFEEGIRYEYEFIKCEEKGRKPSIRCAEILLMLGREGEALNYLEAALERRMFLLPFVKIDPLWDKMRGNSRFKGIVASMNL